MTLLNQVFDIYVDLNITLALTAIIWLAAKLALNRFGRKLAFNYQLAILNGLFAVMVLSPLAVAVYQYMQVAKVVPVSGTLNLADYAVSQYLRGGIAIPAEDFQSLLGLRSRVTESIVSLAPGLGMAIGVFLVAGCAFFAARLGISVVRLKRMLSGCHSWRRSGHLHLLLSDHALVPFSARGLTQNYVVIPSELLAKPDDLKFVLKHEFQHLRQGDVSWEIALEVLRPFFFWNPFFYVWKSEVERLRELACDQKVTDATDVDLRSYCMCLLRAAQAGLRRRQNLAAKDKVGNVAAVALIEVQDRFLRRSPAQKLRRRVEALLEKDRMRPHWSFVCLAVLPMVAIVFLTALSIQKPADWSQDRIMLSTIINLDRMDRSTPSFGQRPLR
ncbi:MAG: M56 family metallopeptidase [Pseudomonadota bacterium]